MKRDHIQEISLKRIVKIKGDSAGPHIVIIDLGILNSFVKQLKDVGCSITLVPYNTDAEKILGLNPDGVIISNGPEADRTAPNIASTVKRLLGKTSILGIAAGHEIIALALRGRISKMRVGHHGVNYPVKSPTSFKGEITVQNHSFVVNEDSLKFRDVKITLRNINDNTIEEMESESLRFISTQYYPASPGFDEVNEVFVRFLNMTKNKERDVEYAKA